jgi:heme A synthase
MNTVHLIVGIAVIAGNLVAGLWGGIAWLRQEPSVGFWFVLRFAQAAVIVQVIVGAILLTWGREPADPGLHYLYGVLPLVVSLLAEAVRAGAAERELEGLDFESLPRQRQRLIALAIVRRETGIMAASALVILFLALRAAGTSGELL